MTNVTSNSSISFSDVKTSKTVHRLWKDGAGGPEYFLVENRQRAKFDASLPGDGLLVWHIDESQAGNTDENHYKVALLQADGKRDMELDRNRGDAGDPYPGSSGNTSLNANSTPNSKSYTGQSTCVSLTGISPSGAVITAAVTVNCGKAKDTKELPKEIRDTKSLAKDQKDDKDQVKERKDTKELAKEIRDTKSVVKDNRDTKNVTKERKDLKDRSEVKGSDFPGGLGAGAAGGDVAQIIAELEARVAALEAGTALGAGASASAEPLIGEDLRPDLAGSPDYSAKSDLQKRMASGDRDAKLAYDTLPPA